MKVKQTKKAATREVDSIAARMREIRINARLTQKEMADIVGLKSGSVGALENGLYTPNFDVIRAIKTRLGISYDYIIDGQVTDKTNSTLLSENKKLTEDVARLTKLIDKFLKS
jgi:transcriptional regulator with XRE-family HTH domain